MALSPNAPDYVSAVRGVLSDLRQNYIQKQQLFQQEQQAQAQIGLGYAQLSAQRDNQARQAALDEQRIALQSAQNERELESLAFNRQRQAMSDRLESQKFDLLQEEKAQKMREIDKKNRDEAESGRLFSLYSKARFSDNVDEQAKAQGEIESSTLSAELKGQVIDGVDKAYAQRMKVQTDLQIKEKRPQVNNVLSMAANLPIDRMTPEDAQDALNQYSMDFQKIETPDSDAANKFNAILSQKQGQLLKIREDETIQGISQLNRDGAQGNVFTSMYSGPTGVAFQKRYDEITKGTTLTDRINNPNIFAQLQGLAADINRVDTQNAVNDLQTKFAIAQENLVKKNGSLGIETVDPVSGDKRTTFVIPMPNMNLTANDIDPRTGKLTKQKEKELQGYDSLLNRTLAGDFNPLQMMLGRTIAQSPAAKSNTSPFIPNNPWAESAQTPVAPTGTAVVRSGAPASAPTAPTEQQIMDMGSDPKTASTLIPGSSKTYGEAAKFLADKKKAEQGKSVANPNSY